MIKPHATIPPSTSCINSIFPHICLKITICCQFFSSFPTSPFLISDLHLKSRESEFHHTQKQITQIRSVGEELLPIDFHFSDYFSFTSKKHQQRHMTGVHSIKVISCEHCGKHFSRSDHLKGHKKTVHLDQTEKGQFDQNLCRCCRCIHRKE